MALQCHAALVTLATSHLETLVQFYSQLLSQPPIAYRPHVYAEFHLPGLRLGMFQPKVEHQAQFQPAAHHAMSLCLEVTDLDAAITHLRAIAAPPPGSIITASHGREVYAYDPDGNRLILHQALEPAASPAARQ